MSATENISYYFR